MKYISKIYNKVIVATLGVMLLAGCVKEIDDNGSNLGGNEKGKTETISILLNVPGEQTPSTKSMDGAKESKSETIDVLVFKVTGGVETFSYHQKGVVTDNLAPSAAGESYKTKFKVNLIVDNNRKIVVVANAGALIDNLFDENAANGEITVDMPKVDVLKLLTVSNTLKWNADVSGFTPIPMYGETGVVNIKPKDNFNMSLTRMLARIDIHNKDNSDFTVSKVYLAKPMTKGYIAPVWDANGKTEQTAATAVNIDDSWTRASGFLMYDMSSVNSGDVNMQQSYKGEIYTFESKSAVGDGEDDATRLGASCLIVEGIYSGKKYFYRVDFTYDGTNSSTKGNYMPLLRNYKYNVVIYKAEGIGYASYNEALSSYTVKSNLKTRIIHYDESVIKNVVSNGQYMLGVETLDMIIDWTGMPVTNFIVTDYDYTYSGDTQIDPDKHENGWRIVGYSDTKNGVISATAPSWMFHPATKETLNATKCNLMVCAHVNADIPDVNGDINFSPAQQRFTYVHVQAGRLVQIIKVTQGVGTQLINMPRQYPNSYMVQPGGTVLIPTLKPYLVWKASLAAGGVGEPLNPCGEVTCELVWQDTQSLIAELELVGLDQGGARSSLFVRGTPGKSGNAVVAVKVDGKIVWSYHVWVSNYEPGNGTGVKHLMDRNMGALMNTWASFTYSSSSPNPAVLTNPNNTIIGLHYQFGRKDPFPREHGLISEISTNTLKKSIEAPVSFDMGWSLPVNNAWNSGNASSPKTIYDPCPLGWRVPDKATWGTTNSPILNGNAFGGFSVVNNGSRSYDSGTYPMGGIRTSGTIIRSGAGGSALAGQCDIGWFWQNVDYYYLFMSLQSVSPYIKYPTSAYAFSVRCVKQ